MNLINNIAFSQIFYICSFHFLYFVTILLFDKALKLKKTATLSTGINLDLV